MLKFHIAPDIRQKLKDKHQVEEIEIEECFLNREKAHLIDPRAEHATEPPTQWFISESDKGRLLKIVWINDPVQGITIKTAFEPNQKEINIYTKYA